MASSERSFGQGRKIEFVGSVGLGYINGSIMYRGKKTGHFQFNLGHKPKRVRNLIRTLKELDINIDITE